MNLEEGNVDIRYFMVANCNRTQTLQPTFPSASQWSVYIDDLEIPPKKPKTQDQIYAMIVKSHGATQGRIFNELVSSFRLKKISAFDLLQTLEKQFNYSRGFKYFWSICLFQTIDSVIFEMHKIMKKSVSKMSFRRPNCVLGVQQHSYTDIFVELTCRLADFIRRQQATIDGYEEYRLNNIISSIRDIDTGKLLQGRSIHHYITSSTLPHLLQVYFRALEELDELFDKFAKEDLVPAYLYLCVLRVKTNPEAQHDIQKLQGLDWICKADRDIDIDCIPLQGKNGRIAKYRATGDKEEFPSLEPAKTGEKTIQDLMKEQNRTSAKSLRPQPRALQQQPATNSSVPRPMHVFSHLPLQMPNLPPEFLALSPKSRAAACGFSVFPIPLIPINKPVVSNTKKK